MTALVSDDGAPAASASASASARTFVSRLGSLVPLLGQHKRVIGMAMAAGAAHQVLLLASAGVGAHVVAEAATGASVGDLTGALIALAVLILPLALFTLADSYFAHVAAFRALSEIRARVYAAFERLSPGYLLERRSGDLGAAAIADVEAIELFFAHTLSPLAVALAVPIATAVALTLFHWGLAVALVPVLVLLATVPGWLRSRADAQGTELREALGAMNADAVDTVQGLRELVAFDAGESRIEMLGAQGRRLRAAKVAHGRRAGLEVAATDAIAALGVIVVVVTGAGLVNGGHLDPSRFPVAVVLAAVSMLPIIKVTDVARELSVVAAAGERIKAIIDAPAPVVDLVDHGPAGPIEPCVRFDAVTFRYAPHLPEALHGVALEIEPGETVALVGHSGAGKSTCANLLLRMWDVDHGSISIGGHDVRAFPQEDLRALITLVPQEPYLFNISIRENIRLGRPDASDPEVEAAARSALAHEFISLLPDGYDTNAGELGARMSGGQRQRIAIARALLKDAPILVMDEAVSALDAVSERELTTAMRAAAADRTTLIVAHRLSTIRTADRIAVLQGGTVTQIGTHDELVARPGTYLDLLASQLQN